MISTHKRFSSAVTSLWWKINEYKCGLLVFIGVQSHRYTYKSPCSGDQNILAKCHGFFADSLLRFLQHYPNRDRTSQTWSSSELLKRKQAIDNEVTFKVIGIAVSVMLWLAVIQEPAANFASPPIYQTWSRSAAKRTRMYFRCSCRSRLKNISKASAQKKQTIQMRPCVTTSSCFFIGTLKKQWYRHWTKKAHAKCFCCTRIRCFCTPEILRVWFWRMMYSTQYAKTCKSYHLEHILRHSVHPSDPPISQELLYGFVNSNWRR